MTEAQEDHEEIEPQQEVDDEPQFGLVDVIEAFTAMRQEWRNQSRESRELGLSLVETSCGIVEIEERLMAATAKIQEIAAESRCDEVSRRLAETIAEIDQHVLWAVHALHRASSAKTPAREPNVASLRDRITIEIQSLGMIAQWCCRPLIDKLEKSISQWLQEEATRPEDSTSEGLQMLVDRIQRLMADQQIERVETVGTAFDGQSMNAVEAIHSSEHASGSVVEQLAPAYRWRGRLLKYAQVRIAK
jgi:hypothetical protein